MRSYAKIRKIKKIIKLLWNISSLSISVSALVIVWGDILFGIRCLATSVIMVGFCVLLDRIIEKT